MKHHVIGFGGAMRPQRTRKNPHRRSAGPRLTWRGILDAACWATVVAATVGGVGWLALRMAKQFASLWS